MAEKGEVLEKFCAFSTNKTERLKTMKISAFTTTRLHHEAERISCDFDAIQAHLRHNKLSVGRIKPSFISRLLQRRPALPVSKYISGGYGGALPKEKFHMI